VEHSTIVEHDGFIYIEDPWGTMWSEPIKYKCCWPTGLRASQYQHLIGKPCFWDRIGSDGTYTIEGGLKIRLEHSGQTKPDTKYTIEKPIPKPKGYKVWRNGQWHKH